jgi:hypothetical protein
VSDPQPAAAVDANGKMRRTDAVLMDLYYAPFYTAVLAERRYQLAKWSDDYEPTAAEFGLILVEEVGEAARELMALQFDGLGELNAIAARAELIQVAAVALRIVEWIDGFAGMTRERKLTLAAEELSERVATAIQTAAPRELGYETACTYARTAMRELGIADIS